VLSADTLDEMYHPQVTMSIRRWRLGWGLGLASTGAASGAVATERIA
jgi:hypothetical protein